MHEIFRLQAKARLKFGCNLTGHLIDISELPGYQRRMANHESLVTLERVEVRLARPESHSQRGTVAHDLIKLEEFLLHLRYERPEKCLNWPQESVMKA